MFRLSTFALIAGVLVAGAAFADSKTYNEPLTLGVVKGAVREMGLVPGKNLRIGDQLYTVTKVSVAETGTGEFTVSFATK